jgi:hypothetical protein
LNLFGTTATTQFEKYLGLPLIIGRAKIKALMTSKIEWDADYKGGKKNYYYRRGVKFLLKL